MLKKETRMKGKILHLRKSLFLEDFLMFLLDNKTKILKILIRICYFCSDCTQHWLNQWC